MTKAKSAGVEPGKELTLQERAVVALGMAEREQELIELASQSKSITKITNADGRQQCHAARMVLKNERVAIEKAGKAARDDANAFAKAVIAEEKRLVGLISAEEQRLHDLQQEYDEREERERQEAIEREAKRVEGIRQRIAEIRAHGENIPFDVTSAALQKRIDAVAEIVVDGSFEEFHDQARDAVAGAVARLREALAQVKEREEDDARRKAEQEELDRRRAEEERQATIRSRIRGIRALSHIREDAASSVIQDAIDELERTTIDESFGEFQEEAQDAKDATLVRLRPMHELAVQREQEEQRRREELERREQELAEERKREARKQDVRNQVQIVRNLPSQGYGKTAGEIARILARAEGFAIDWQEDDDEELCTEAKEAKEDAISALSKMLAERKEYEAEQERIRQEREAREKREREEAERKEAAKKAKYPGDEQIVAAVMVTYDVPADVAIKWLTQYSKSREKAA